MAQEQEQANRTFAFYAFSNMALFSQEAALDRAAARIKKSFDENMIAAARDYTLTMIKSWGGI